MNGFFPDPDNKETVGGNKYVTCLVTSCKGGIGKSTVCANLAMSCARTGHKVLLIDFDFSNRALDLILGCENDVVYDICDVAYGRVPARSAVITDRRCGNLFFLPAPLFAREDLTTARFISAVDAVVDEYGCDTVFVDTPGAADSAVSLAAPAADAALIIASHHPTSVRGAEKMGMTLSALGIERQYLIINKYDCDSVLNGERSGINELIDKTHIRLLGVIPVSETLELYQEKGKLACEIKKDKDGINPAFDEIAERLNGERVPLMSFISEKKRKKILNT